MQKRKKMRSIYPFFSKYCYYLLSFWTNSNLTKLMKVWIKYRKLIKSKRAKTDFLHKCIRNNLVPSHVGNLLMNFENNFTHHRSIRSFKHLRYPFIRKLLCSELNNIYHSSRFAYAQIFKLSRTINYYILIVSVCNSFFIRQNGPLYSYFVKERNIEIRQKIQLSIGKTK